MKLLVRWPNYLLIALFVSAVASFLITANVKIAFSTTSLYEYGFSRNQVSHTTGISKDDLRLIASDFTTYFNSEDEFLDIQTRIHGVEQSLLNRRELIHMRDVKVLVGLVGWVQVISLTFLGLYSAIGFIRFRAKFAVPLARYLRTAGLATATGIGILGLFSAIAFPSLFYLFHVVSFSNTLWQLNPDTDYLIWLFPSQFFFEATLLLALSTFLEAATLTFLSWVWLRHSRQANTNHPSSGQEPLRITNYTS